MASVSTPRPIEPQDIATPSGQERRGPAERGATRRRDSTAHRPVEVNLVYLEMSERRLLLEVLERESRSAVRMMRVFPPDRLDQHPTDCLQTARQLAWRFVEWERLVHYVLLGRTTGTALQAPDSMFEIVCAYEDAHRETRAALLRMSQARWLETIRGPVGAARWERGQRGELLWMAWKELTLHGEHFAAHLRLACAEEALSADRRGRELTPAS